MTVSSREWRLAARPQGAPTAEDFAFAKAEVPAPGPGQILVRNTWLSVDPYMRGRMDDRESYVAPYAIDAAMEGGAVGVVEASESPDVAVGETVLHNHGWREYAVVDAKRVAKVDTSLAPAQAFLGVLGMPGLTAYAGVVEVGALAEGETFFVSAAAGAVGSLAGQIAKLRGAGRVVGSAGSADKVAWLTSEGGFDAAFDYKAGPVRRSLREAAPDGVDVYFDNVGGEHLEVAVGWMKVHGRIAICGMISQYNAREAQPGPRNLALFIGRRITMRGFLVGDHGHLRRQFLAEVGPWLAEGRIASRETVVEGLENAADAFLGLLAGANTGKMLVKV